VFLASSPGGGPAVVLASPTGLRTSHGGTLLLQSSSAQQIMLPHGFQGGTLNLKTLQGLQGIRVIPLSQAAAAAAVSPNTSFPKGKYEISVITSSEFIKDVTLLSCSRNVFKKIHNKL
jgi:hypothetical protein